MERVQHTSGTRPPGCIALVRKLRHPVPSNYTAQASAGASVLRPYMLRPGGLYCTGDKGLTSLG